MRIALVSPYALSQHGGVQDQVVTMSRALEQRGHDVLVVAPDVDDSSVVMTSARVERFGRRVRIPANGSRAPLTLSWSAARRARRAIREFDAEIVHFHEPFAPLVGWSQLIRHDRPSLATFHRSGGGPAVSLTRPLLRWLRRGLDDAVAVSAMAARTMGAAAGMTCEIWHNGFDTEWLRSTERFRRDEITLLCIGRFEERKGIATAITAVQRHNRTSDVPWRLRIIGDGPQAAQLHALGDDDVAIDFLGAVSDEEKLHELRGAHALLCPALYGESFGLVLLEGMAAETAVVASDIDGYREAAGGQATLAAPGDEASWERAITVALSTESIASARAHAENWGMSSLVTRYEERYRRLVENGSAQ